MEKGSYRRGEKNEHFLCFVGH